MLGLHLLPQLLGEGERGFAVLGAPLRLFGLFEAAFDGARCFFLCLTSHDVGRLVYGGVVCPTVHDVRGVVGGCHVVIAEARERPILGRLALIEFVLLFIVTPLMFIALVVVTVYAVIAFASWRG